MEIADGVFTYRGRSGERIRPGAGSSSVTVVRGNDCLLMIDTGVRAGKAYDEVLSAIKRDSLDPREVGWIGLTHAHWDHINAAQRIASISGAAIAASRTETPYIEDRRSNFRAFIPDFKEFVKEIFPFPLPAARILVRYAWGRQPDVTVTKKLDDGDVIDIGREVRAFALPGHTDGHTGFFIPDAGVLIAGDLVDFENSEGMDLNNPRSSFESAVDSIRRAIIRSPDVYIPGHGEPISGRQNVHDMLERALICGRTYPDAIRAALGEEPQRLKEILRTVFPDTPFSMEAMKLMLILVVLLYMEKRGEAKRVVKKGRPAWVSGEIRK